MNTKPTFSLGNIVMTPGAIAALEAAGADPGALLARHAAGDWGDVDREEWESNDAAVRRGDRLLSVYTLATDQKIWAITEWDRSATTLLRPDEY